MPKSDQGVNNSRYTVIPRTLIFVVRGAAILLIKGAPTKRLWANRYNGLGGHVERGEDVHSAALRELREEAGIAVERLDLVGTVIVDADPHTGIAIFIFKGEYPDGPLVASSEGSLEWIGFDALDGLPLVEDLKILLPRVISFKSGARPFSARSYYDAADKLVLDFGK